MSAESIAVPVLPSTWPVLTATRPPRESLSPFIAWREDERDTSLDSLLADQPPSLLRELLTAPAAIAARLNGPDPLGLVQSCLLVLVCACAFSGALLALTLEAPVLKTALLVPLSLLVALVAALGPIAAVSIVVGVRVPWSRLSGTLVAAMASGALAASAVTPFAVVLHRLDAEWAGPLAVVTAFALAGLVAGTRTRDLLLQLASAGGADLEADRRERVAMLARISTVVVGFTAALAIWSFGALG